MPNYSNLLSITRLGFVLQLLGLKFQPACWQLPVADGTTIFPMPTGKCTVTSARVSNSRRCTGFISLAHMVATSTPKRPWSRDDIEESPAGKRVWFGLDISPELLDSSLPASSPVRRGGRMPTSPVPKKRRPDTDGLDVSTLTSSRPITRGTGNQNKSDVYFRQL